MTSFGAADHGIAWAASQLPVGKMVDGKIIAGGLDGVAIRPFDGAKGKDDFAIRFEGNAAAVLANTAVGAINGLLRLGEMLRADKREDVTVNLRYRTRNYKHELRLDDKSPRSILKYTDELWEGLCRKIVASGFNGLTLYPPGHPFEYILDYSDFANAASRSDEQRAAVRERLNRGLAIAHQYGLKTFMQHYIGHFTQQLADAYKITTTGRLSAIDHPEVNRYCRWCYEEMFRQVPDLDGLYFNYESFADAHEHILKTAIPAFNAMARKPIMVHRLWNYANPDGMKKMMDAYAGRTIVSHKVIDTNDTYYLPVADSRARDWKKLIPNLEWMYCAGPCHNCGTNLSDQLWGDYRFVQDLLADTVAQGADSISFHTVNEFIAPEIPDPNGVFAAHELEMARFNRLHLQAAVDFFHGRSMDAAQRASFMAGVLKISPKAGKAYLDMLETTSQQVLLIYQQFCYGSNMDGYLNPGRWSLIQEPFYFSPASERNDQASRLMWSMEWPCPWIPKTIDRKVCPDDYVQYIVDFVDPAKPKAKLNPRKIAEKLQACASGSIRGLSQFRKLAGSAGGSPRGGKKLADQLDPYVRNNADLGMYIAHQIKAGLALYSLYFAKTKAAMVVAVKRGLAELEAAEKIFADKTTFSYKSALRVLMLNRLDNTVEIAHARELLALVQATDFPMEAFKLYARSHAEYNELRRLVRPNRHVNDRVMAEVRKLMQASIATAEKCLHALGDGQSEPVRHYFHERSDGKHPKVAHYDALAGNVRRWLWFVRNELARTAPPVAKVGPQPTAPLSLQHDDCFHEGYPFLEDFLSFFRPVDHLQPAALTARVWRTEKELVVSLREQGVNVAARQDRWQQYRNEGSNSYVFRVFLDTPAGRRSFIIWPLTGMVNSGFQPNVPARTEFTSDAVSFEHTVYLPWELIGAAPAAGEIWGLNVTSNPAVIANYAYTWAPQYDGADNPLLYGKVTFE